MREPQIGNCSPARVFEERSYLLEQGLPGAIEFFENALWVRLPAIGFGIEM